MKLVFRHENRLLVSNAQNILENAGIKTIIKNEFASAAVGELSPFDTWMELWLQDENDAPRALQLLEGINKTTDQSDWKCSQCDEINGAAFDYCWNCHNEKPKEH